MKMRRVICGMAAALSISSMTWAQEFRATIGGQISDASGAVVAGARVTVANIDRNTTETAVSNATGRYLVQFLMPGAYSVTVAATGFKQYTQRGIRLEAADHVDLDVKLEVGAQTDFVTVTGEAPLLETENANRASTVENRVLENVPTNGRNLFALQYNLPGVVKARLIGDRWSYMPMAMSMALALAAAGSGRTRHWSTGCRIPRWIVACRWYRR